MDSMAGFTGKQQDYLSYLLRLWRVPGQVSVVWRASLECPVTGECAGFGSLDDLVAFLHGVTGDLPGDGIDGNGP